MQTRTDLIADPMAGLAVAARRDDQAAAAASRAGPEPRARAELQFTGGAQVGRLIRQNGWPAGSA